MTRYLVGFVLVVGIGYWGYSWWQDRLAAEEKQIAREARQQTLKHSVADMATKANAVTDWAATLAGDKRMRSGPIMTAELQKLWLSDRPVLFIGNVRDVAINNDGAYQVTVEYEWLGARHMFLENEIRVSLGCPESFATQLIQTVKANKGPRFSADTAVVAIIEKVETSIEKENGGDTVTVLTGVGKCVNAMQLTERIFW
jgi:hypothetical protein